jgi:DNA-binding transcriptional ArsR family regulator
MPMDIFNALAVPSRRDILELLAARGSLSATDIYDKFDASPPAISQHLKVLRDTKLVVVEKQGQQRMYQINPNGMQEFELWSQKITNLWNKRLDKLGEVLKAEKKRNKDKYYETTQRSCARKNI